MTGDVRQSQSKVPVSGRDRLRTGRCAAHANRPTIMVAPFGFTAAMSIRSPDKI